MADEGLPLLLHIRNVTLLRRAATQDWIYKTVRMWERDLVAAKLLIHLSGLEVVFTVYSLQSTPTYYITIYVRTIRLYVSFAFGKL